MRPIVEAHSSIRRVRIAVAMGAHGRSSEASGVAERDVADVVVDAAAGARVGDLIVALAGHLEVGAAIDAHGWSGLRLADGRDVGPDDLVGDLEILHGDRLVVIGSDDRPGGRVVAAVERRRVVSLVDPAGRSHDLGPGRTAIGRSADCDVVLDDPSVSRHHATLTVTVDGSIRIADESSTNGTYVDGVAVAGDQRLAPGSVVEFGDVGCDVVEGPSPTPLWPSVPPRSAQPRSLWTRSPTPVPNDGVVPYNRPPVIIPPVAEVVVDGPDVPAPVPATRMPWLSITVPLLLAGVIVAVGVASSGGGLGGSYLLMSAGFLVLSPVMMIAAHWESKRSVRRALRDGRAAFDAAVLDAERIGKSALADELRTRTVRHPAPGEWRRRAATRRDGLWGGLDLVGGALRVGVGPVPSSVRLETSGIALRPSAGDVVGVECRDAISSLAARLASHVAAPVLVHLASTEAIAIVGSDRWRRDATRAIVLQLATVVAPGDLDVSVAGPTDAWDWVKWLPHRVSAVDEPCPDQQVTTGLALSVIDADALDEQGHATAIASMGRRDAHPGGTALALWLGSRVAAAPMACGVVIEEQNDGSGRVSVVVTGDSVAPVEIDRVDAAEADAWARDLAPVVLDRRSGGATVLPDEVTLGEVLGDGRVIDDVEAVVARWRQGAGLVAPIGRTAGGVLRVDLRRDGPHGIVAGTTGSGKSELLQTFVAALAATNPPSRVNFLLIDYKGGAAFGACSRLPHTVGLVTDLDDVLVGRVLVSLRAEVRRRERALAAAGCKDLAAMEAVTDDAPPSLVVVVDEFASLTAEVPEFIEGMVDIGRRGRSLGIHLLLATQRPAGVVSDQLRANANLRIALRVADSTDSSDIIGVGDAASIERSVPGRALALLGHGDLTEFQAAHGGARSIPADTDRRHPTDVVVRPLTLSSRSGTTAATAGPTGVAVAGAEAETDLGRLISTIVDSAAVVEEPPPRRPWLEPLPDELLLDAVERHRSVGHDAGRLMAMLGIVDDPERQDQRPVHHDLAAGATLVHGAAASSAACVESLVVSAITGRSPTDVRVDVIDGDVGALTGLASFPQVGSVIEQTDGERVGRLLRQLREIVRRGPMGTVRLLVVNDLVGFAAVHGAVDGGALPDSLARLISDGASAGVHVLMAADRRIGLPGAIAASVARRVVLAMPSSDDAAALGADPTLLVGQAPGRAVVDGLAVQTAVVAPGGRTSSPELARLAAVDAGRYSHLRAPEVGVLPDRVEAASLPQRTTTSVGGPSCRLLVGMSDRDLAPVHVSLDDGNLLVAGPVRSGRTSAIGALASSVPGVRRLLVAPRTSEWCGATIWDDVGVGADAHRLMESLTTARSTAVGAPSATTIVFVDDATDLDEDVDAALAEVARHGRRGDIRVVAAAEAALARTTYGGLVAQLRRERRALLLQPDVDLDGDLAGVRLHRRSSRPVPPGRGELVDRGRIDFVQVALASEALARGGRPPFS